MLRLTLAVAAGFLTMSVLAIATRVALAKLFFPALPSVDADMLPPAYWLANGVISLVCAVVGGCMSAAIGRKYEAPTILGALLLGMAIGGVVIRSGNQPLWYTVLAPLAGAVAATIAGYRWLGRQAAAE